MTTNLELLADASLAYLEILEPYFNIVKYNSISELLALIKNHKYLLCRANTKIDAHLLQNSAIECVATASSGIDHIDLSYLHANKIKLLDAKSCNAQAVCDYVIASIAYCKKNNLLQGKKVGIVGLGAVGSLVFKMLKQLQFEVCYYDPFISKNSIDNLFQCDILCLHPNLQTNSQYPSLHLINSHFLKKLKNSTIIINASRGMVVDERSIIKYKNLFYCTDVYENEPNISKEIIDYAVLCTPHIAGHTVEAKKNAILILKNKFISMLNLTKLAYAKVKTNSNFTNKTANKKIIFDSNIIDKILRHYDPSIETKILKETTNLQDEFLRLRVKHVTRHDMC